MATKTPTTSTASPSTLGTNRQTSPPNQPPRPQPGPRQPNPNEQPRPFSPENRPQRNNQEQNHQNQEPETESHQQEQRYNYVLSQARAERAQIKNAEDYRSHFKKSSGFLWTVAYSCAVIDYIIGLIEDTLVGAPAVVISIILDVVTGFITVHVGRKMTNMHNSMEALIQGVDASAQKTVNRKAAAADYRRFAVTAASSKQKTGKTSNRAVKNGAKSFLGKMIGSDLIGIVPYANLWPWQFRTTQKMHKHEKAMIAEGLSLVDEYVITTKQELEANIAYANAAVEELE